MTEWWSFASSISSRSYVMSDISVVFFFKQKTAYEMRISDWSSDVVLFRSLEDLPHLLAPRLVLRARRPRHAREHQQPPSSGPVGRVDRRQQIGRASCRERVCQYVSISVVAVSLKKTKTRQIHRRTNTRANN